MNGRQQGVTSLRRLVTTRRSAIVTLAAASFGGGLAEAAFLVVVTRGALAVANGSSGAASGAVSAKTTLFLAALLLTGRLVLALLSAWMSAALVTGVGVDLRKRITLGFLRSSWPTQHGERSGRLQELVVGYTDAAAGLVGSFANALAAALSLAAMIAVSLVIDAVASIAVVAALLVMAAAVRPVRRRLRQSARTASAQGLSLATSISELSAIGLEIHTFGVQDEIAEHVTGLIDAEASTRRRVWFLQGSVGPVYTSLAYAAVVAALALAAVSGATELSGVGAVMLVMLRSLGYGQSLQSSAANMLGAMPFLDTLDETIERYERTPARATGTVVTHIGAVRAEHVDFSYQPDGPPVLHDISFSVPAGTILGIIGPSGSGKSTLVQLLLGAREPTRGAICVGDSDLRTIDRRLWAAKVAFVAQDAQLFAGSIAANIAFFRTGVTPAAIQRAARRAHLHDEILAMPDGYATDVGERGGRLSGGQRQRLAIARALLNDPELLILDEPTSALDVLSEAGVRATLADLAGTTTVVIIAHRLSTLDMCSQLMVLLDGRMAAFGTPEHLAHGDAFYREVLELSGLR